MRFFVSWRIPTKENKWQGFNVTRYRSEEYDKIFLASESELDPVKRAALLIKLNDIICADRSVIPIVHRPSVSAISHKLRAPISGWDNDLWNLRDWWREG
jgi:peptide/nickel transport system substrate-binding protein